MIFSVAVPVPFSPYVNGVYPRPDIQDRNGMKRFLVSKDESDGKKARGTDEAAG